MSVTGHYLELCLSPVIHHVAAELVQNILTHLTDVNTERCTQQLQYNITLLPSIQGIAQGMYHGVMHTHSHIHASHNY